MDTIFLERFIAHHRLAIRVAYIGLGLSVLGWLFQRCATSGLTPICVPLGGAAEYVSYLTFGGVLLALGWFVWSKRQAEKLPSLNGEDPAAALEGYKQLWYLFQFFGVAITIAAVSLFPLSIPTLMMGVPGVAAVFAVYAGTWIYFRGRKLNREAFAHTVTASSSDSDSTDGSDEAEGAVDQAGGTSEAKKSNAGIVPLAVATSLLVLNVCSEIGFLNQIRSLPSFYRTPSNLDANVSLPMGFAGFFDVVFGGSIGIVMLIYAIKIRKSMAGRRLLAITLVSVLQFALVSGTVAPALARWLGPNATGAQAQRDAISASETFDYLEKQPQPAGFIADQADSPQDDVNRWRMLSTEHFTESKHAEICRVVIDYAISQGASKWLDKSTKTTGVVSDSAATDKACIAAMDSYPHLKVASSSVTSEAFVIAGKAKGGGRSPISFTLTLVKNSMTSDYPRTFIYDLEIATTYNNNPLATDGGLSQGTIEINDLLNLFGQERLAAPDRNPTDPTFVRETLKLYKHKIPIKVFETKPGVANHLELTNSDGSHMCLAIDPWDAEREGMADPGYGYGLGFQESLKDLKGFGLAVEGGCK